MSPQSQMKSLLELEGEHDAPNSGAQASGGESAASRSSGGGSLRERVTELLSGGAGRILLLLFLMAALGFGALQVRGFVEEGSPDLPRLRIMNPETNEMGWFYAAPGKQLPEGFYPVEYCFDNECGPAGGTPVVLKLSMGVNEPTECPVCGAQVVGHNPRPDEYVGVVPADQKMD